MDKTKLAIKILLLLALSGSAFGQYEKIQYGGVRDVFDMPVSARALGMGGAFVAVANDPYALYWNPAGLDNAPYTGLGLYYTDLGYGSQYNYASFTFPTLSFGTFSAGVIRLGTSGIEIRGDSPLKLGEENFAQTMFMFGYGVHVAEWLSIGTTLKVERAVYPGYPDEFLGEYSSFTETSAGADLGLLYSSTAKSGLFKNFHIGLNIQNAIQRTVQIVDAVERTPRNFRLGLAKSFNVLKDTNYLIWATDIVFNESLIVGDKTETIPLQTNMGLEHVYQGVFKLRIGVDIISEYETPYKPTLGAGVNAYGFEIDYAYWGGRFTELGASHRISLVYNIGQDRETKRQQKEINRLEQLDKEVAAEMEMERKQKILDAMEKADLFYAQKNYKAAKIALTTVISLDNDKGNDPEVNRARQLLTRVDNILEEETRVALQEQINLAAQEQERARQEQAFEDYYEEAKANLQNELYYECIMSCNDALKIKPNSELVASLKERALEQRNVAIENLRNEALELQKSGKTREAHDKFRKARDLSKGVKDLEGYFQGQMDRLIGNLNHDNIVKTALEYERQGNWSKAAEHYARALNSAPNDANLKSRYDRARARMNAKKMVMTKNVQVLFRNGGRAYINKRYDEAVEYFQKALDEQPQNIDIIKALDMALEKQRKLEESSKN